MRQTSCFIVKLVFALCILGQPSLRAGDSLDYLKQLLQRSAATEVSSDNDRPAEGILRIAQQPREASANPVKSTESTSPPTLAEKTREVRQAEAAAQQVESKVNRQVSALERQLEREQSALEVRLNELNKKREAALSKNDEKQLERIQTLETAAVKEYERRIERILALAAPKSELQSTTSSRAPQTPHARQNNPRASQNQPQQPEQQPKRWRRLWPFS